MTQGKNVQNDLTRLERVLDCFGADPARWPEHERRLLEQLVETNSAARQLLDEAGALARVMDAAPGLEASSSLKSRIVAAALEDAGHDARIIPIRKGRPRAAQTVSARRMSAIWPAAALAASFAFGLYLGVAGIGGSAVDGAFEVAMSGASAGEAGAISWLESGASVNEDGPL